MRNTYATLFGDVFFCEIIFVNHYQFIVGQKSRVSIPQDNLCNLVSECKSCTDILTCDTSGANRCDECNYSSSTHFYCSSGKPLFVERTKVEDGKNDCSDGSDKCPPSFLSKDPLSSKEQLIRSVPLQVFVWIMAILSLGGNFTVFTRTFRQVYGPLTGKTQQGSSTGLIHNLLVLNLSIADFLMGIVLLILCLKFVEFFGRYCQYDKLWRTSATCDLIGVLTVLSSEASVLTLVCITSYRVYSVYCPFKSLNAKPRHIFLCIISVWFVSFCIALLPLSQSLFQYMVTHALVTKSLFFQSDVTDYFEFSEFPRKLSGLNNRTDRGANSW